MDRTAFEPLGVFLEAGRRATELALEASRRSFEAGRIPIAGAAVSLDAGGALRTVAVGVNGRVAPPGSNSPGYPTDHGETAAVRAVERFADVDWNRTVFATTLSPCIMCTRTLLYLGGLGLDKIVIAEAENYPGEKARLVAAGMTVVELRDAGTVERMRAFAREAPSVWSADIGELVPRAGGGPMGDVIRQERMLAQVAGVRGEGAFAAAVFGPDGERLAACADGRERTGGNPTAAPVIVALGEAGSAANLRECLLVVSAAEPIDVAGFGLAALGACELFRPAALLTDAPLADELEAALAPVIAQRIAHGIVRP
ncbi:MAG: hypothetical protein GY711_16365 [bacterium]|nr:hypothetical protein [bacterium]